MKSLSAVALLILSTINLGYSQFSYIPSGNTLHIYNTNPGNVGIGTGSSILPKSKLQVSNGNILLDYGGSGTTGNLYFGGQTDINQSGLRLSHINMGSSYIDVRTAGTAGSNGLIFRIDALGTGNTERMRINANGNVGIGTANPTQKLEITHNDLAGGIVLNQTAPLSSKSEIKFSKNGVEKWAIGSDIDNNNGQTFFIWDQPGSASRMVINGYGKIGIGTNPPNNNSTIYKLYVEGGIVTRDLKVTANTFADYVFSKDYKLLKLNDLEKYLQENKHLPGIPSESEVIKNEGFEIGKLQVQMLEKLEEQALYIIDLQKQIIDMQKQFSDFKSQIENSKQP
ncbi:MAG TPA: hypothetical protein VFG10_09845 [Saprospiraceae bacterium]|nr:hypothetical protein [Saprospiraceae bacterium]